MRFPQHTMRQERMKGTISYPLVLLCLVFLALFAFSCNTTNDGKDKQKDKEKSKTNDERRMLVEQLMQIEAYLQFPAQQQWTVFNLARKYGIMDKEALINLVEEQWKNYKLEWDVERNNLIQQQLIQSFGPPKPAEEGMPISSALQQWQSQTGQQNSLNQLTPTTVRSLLPPSWFTDDPDKDTLESLFKPKTGNR